MRALVIFAALAPFAAGSACAEPLPVKLADGATWTLTIEHARDDDRPGRKSASSVTSVKRLTWRKGQGGSDRLTVTPVSTTPGPGSPPGLAAATSLEVPVTLEVDEALTPERVVNTAEVRASFQAMLQRIGSDPAALAIAKDTLAGLTDASITALATQDLARVALSQGMDLKPGEEVSYQEDRPNPLGGGPIRSNGSYRLESLDRRSGRAVVVWRQTFDPASAAASVAAMVEAMMSRVSADKAAEARAALSTMKLERNDTCRHEIDVETGLAVSAACSASTVAGAGSQQSRRTDRWTITQTLPGKP
jgi:hypothetical protein